MDRLVDIIKALSDSTRLRIFMTLKDKERCVCRITELMKLAPSTVSKHLSILKGAGLVKTRKEGKWIHYRLNDEPGIGKQLSEVVIENLSGEKIIIEDSARLESLMKKYNEGLCCK